MAYTDGSQPSQYACIILWRLNDDHEVEFLIEDSRTFDKHGKDITGRQVKFPGGMSRVGVIGEPARVIAAREFLEETYLNVDMSHAQELEQVHLHHRKHTKHGFLLSAKCSSGEMRTTVLRDGDDEMQPPRWIHHLWLDNEPQPKAHRDFCKKAILELRRMGVIK